MDDLKLPSILFLIWDIKRAIEKNLSLTEGLKLFLSRSFDVKSDKFAQNFKIWLTDKKSGKPSNLDAFNAQQRAVINLIESGLSGLPIYEQLKSVELSFIETCEADIQEHAAKLPLILQFPLIFLIFPAICMLLIIPTLSQLTF